MTVSFRTDVALSRALETEARARVRRSPNSSFVRCRELLYRRACECDVGAHARVPRSEVESQTWPNEDWRDDEPDTNWSSVFESFFESFFES